jgi:thiamine-monophosphate kinase
VPLAEKALIARIRRMADLAPGRTPKHTRAAHAFLEKGIGDDCAVLRVLPRTELLVTTDFSLEGVHFRRDWHSPESVGHRCLARGLSDIAAMGGEALAAFLSLALPRDLSQVWVDRFARGLINLAEKNKVPLAGGDTAQSPDRILADIVVLGTVPQGKAILRSGAHPGDCIYVTGELGGSASAVVEMRETKRKLNARSYPRHFFPVPRINIGRVLREQKIASAMIDLSDGLSTDLAHICQESRVGAEISVTAIPRARVGSPAREVDLELALHGGEDYELLFTAPANQRVPAKIGGVPVTRIGAITRGHKISLKDAGGRAHELQPRGWEHFRR